MIDWRRITKSERDPRLKTLLQNLFVAEAIDPSGVVYLISPWTRNIEVIENRGGEFDWVDADWPHGSVRLIDWVRTLCVGGGKVRILQGDAVSGHSFNQGVARLQREFPEGQLEMRTTGPLSQSGSNHAKAVLTPNFSLTGSMNISEPGLQMHIEHIELRLQTNEEYATVKRQFEELWRQHLEG